jgi:ribosomal RNA-processing protein 36
MTSKRAVSRKRDFVTIPKPQHRDPRFGPLGAPVNEAKARKAYAFLDEYRNDEMKQLKATIKKTKDAVTREELKRELLSMESRKKTQDRKDRARKVLEEHRIQEKELIKQGKKPFYLKRSEQKERLLKDQYASMNKRQVDKLIERKRKKDAAKEKKELPMSRREY